LKEIPGELKKRDAFKGAEAEPKPPAELEDAMDQKL
jgi:hypothetical protein